MGRVRANVPGHRRGRIRTVVLLVLAGGLALPVDGQEALPELPAAEATVDPTAPPPIGVEADAEPPLIAEEVGEAEPAEEAAPATSIGNEAIMGLIRDANPMLIPLLLCSIATLGFTLERLFALRRSRVIPRDFVERFLDRLSSGKLDRDRAAELCRAHDSPVARIFGHAIRYWGQPATAIRQAVDADAGTEIVDMKRNVRVLNGTAMLAPLLGLLGTVVGLIESFDALGGPMDQGVARGEALAHGISLALVATAFGLAIAIVSVVAYYYLLNRVDGLVRELDEQVRRVIELVSAESWSAPDRRGVSGLTAAERARTESRVL